ncbi:MAG: AMIN domain-containing protein, partial [candidate division NC10 bacterium]
MFALSFTYVLFAGAQAPEKKGPEDLAQWQREMSRYIAERLPGVELLGVEVAGDTITLLMSGPAKFDVFATTAPPRLVVNLFDTTLAASAKAPDVRSPLLKDVRLAQFKSKPNPIARVVLDIERALSYQVRLDGVSLTIKLGQSITEPKRPLHYTGFVADPSGRPLEGVQRLRFTLVRPAGAAPPIWSDTLDVEVKSGAFKVQLGNETPLPKEAFGLEYIVRVSPAWNPAAAAHQAPSSKGGPSPLPQRAAGASARR